MKIISYIQTLFNENINVSKIKITNFYNFNQNSFIVTLDNNQQINIAVENYQSDYQEVVEFYDANNELVAKAKGFDSVL